MSRNWTHLVRFLAEEDGQVHLGQIDATKWPDVGLATYKGEKVEAKLVNGTIYDGQITDRVMHISKVRETCYAAQTNTETRSFSLHLQWKKFLLSDV